MYSQIPQDQALPWSAVSNGVSRIFAMTVSTPLRGIPFDCRLANATNAGLRFEGSTNIQTSTLNSTVTKARKMTLIPGETESYHYYRYKYL